MSSTVPETVRTKHRSGHAEALIVEPEGLGPYVQMWERLAQNTVTPNPFYEPWMLLPAIESIASRDGLHILLIFGPGEQNGAQRLWGLFPLQLQTRCLHLPIRTFAFWQHFYCYLTVPLIDQDHVEEVLDCFWRWVETNPLNCRILDTNYFLAEGPFHAAWADSLIGRCTLVLNEHPRAVQIRAASFESYVQDQFSKKRQNAMLQRRRQLERAGEVVYREVESIAEVSGWVDQFLALEAGGWKGKQRTAIAQHPGDTEFFRAMTHGAFARNRARLLSLECNGQPIAMNLTLTAADGAFIFRIAYDEDYAKYSPGLLLELQHLRQWHGGAQTNWVDSGAAPHHPMFDVISNGRRVIRRTLVSNGSSAGDFLVSFLPLMRWLRHTVLPHRSLTSRVRKDAENA
jgi:hypothetical protein